MKGKVSKLMMVLAVCLMAFPCLIYGASSVAPAPASHSAGKIAAALQPKSNEKPEHSPMPVPSSIYDSAISGNGKVITSSFALSSENSGNIGVSFTNNGTSAVNVKLQTKKRFGKWSNVEVIGRESSKVSVASGSSDHIIFEGSPDATYRIRLDSSKGVQITGHLVVAPTLFDGYLYDNPDMSSKSSFTTSNFKATASAPVQVWFDNQGTEAAKVRLYKKVRNDNKKTGEFSVKVKSDSSENFNVKKGDTYCIGVDSEYGSVVKGSMQVKRAD